MFECRSSLAESFLYCLSVSHCYTLSCDFVFYYSYGVGFWLFESLVRARSIVLTSVVRFLLSILSLPVANVRSSCCEYPAVS